MADIRKKLKDFLRYHLHIVLYSYFWFGLFICGLAAPDERVAELQSGAITKGWHLSLLSMVLILPVPIIYFFRLRRPSSKPPAASKPRSRNQNAANVPAARRRTL